MGTRKLIRETVAALEKDGFKVEHTAVVNDAHIAYYVRINDRVRRLTGSSSPSDERHAINNTVQAARRLARADAARDDTGDVAGVQPAPTAP